MATGGPDRVRRVGFRAQREPAPAPSLMRLFAGLAAILFPVLNILSLNYIDIERYNPSNTVAGLIFLLAYVLLLPLVYVLYQELRAVSQPLSAGVSLLGVGVPASVATGVLFGLNINSAAILTVTCLTLWIGIAGYLAFRHHILGRAWSVFSMAIGVVAWVAAVLTVMLTISSGAAFLTWSSYGLAVGVWTVWTGVMVMLRARVRNLQHGG